jgi:CDGSH-type Zn-finger protein
MIKNTKIKVSKNGPYLVSGNLPLNEDIVEFDQDGVPLKTTKGKQYPQQENYSLCRCGHSQNKPFCDGTHLQVEFDGTETAPHDKYEDEAQIINGPGLILKDNPPLCAGLGFCHRQNGTWSETENSDNTQSKKVAIETACCCASGRLTACDKQTKKPIEPKLEPSISILEDGPICLKGGVPIESTDGVDYEVRNRVTLCRCGKSQNKPFCDASHQDE